MVIGACKETSLKKRSEELDIPFSDLLWGYMIEDMMLRIYQSEYKDILWLETVPIIGEAAYRAREQKRISFFYQENDRPMPPEKLKPGQKLSVLMAEQLMADIFCTDNRQEIHWEGQVHEKSGIYFLGLEGTYCQMRVPVMLCLHGGREEKQIPGRREEELTAIPGKKVSYFIYAPEYQLSRAIFTIMERLELVSDMGCYWKLYETLKNQSLSGRFVLEELEILAEQEPKVKTKKRLEQIAGYRNYSYMRKRWEKYLRNHKQKPVAWEEALDLILNFAEPVWNCLCDNQIFFDDWMPELGRFLG